MPLSDARDDRHIDGPIPFAALASDPVRLRAWLDRQDAAGAGWDDKAAAASLVGRMGWDWVCAAATQHLGAERAAIDGGIAADTLHLVAAHWLSSDAAPYPMLTCRVTLAGPRIETSRALGQRYVAAFAPLIAQVGILTGLPPTAQWRLLADALHTGCLAVGRDLGCIDAAMDLARAGLIAAGAPLWNRQVHYRHLSATRADGTTASDWFTFRGGCCRHYTTPGRATYSTCVLRCDDDRAARLERWLQDQPQRSDQQLPVPLAATR
ncbi:hypothetical protein SAMN04488003_10687 [Loktanella fryxellensis]|uniref:Ferric iron reductase protein FhuF, involved in iron transport n=1 Tax=Loktanella fryxellensis TaxID=245187 RepID=A0A1H8C733_9RHOB|nr:hypothetical protein [Loktanella fryxellensis]SEM90883.1 hypothetical protein SAMN04488003_10687 [Loktanella fryxellensis]